MSTPDVHHLHHITAFCFLYIVVRSFWMDSVNKENKIILILNIVRTYSTELLEIEINSRKIRCSKAYSTAYKSINIDNDCTNF